MFHLIHSRPDWDDIVFKGRNKAYGAYQLRKSYHKNVRTALLWMLGGVAILSASPYIVKSFHEEREIVIVTDSSGIFEETPVNTNRNEPEVPELNPAPKQPSVHEFRFVPPVVMHEDDVREMTETVRSMEELEGRAIGTSDQVGETSGDMPNLDGVVGGTGTAEVIELKAKPETEVEPAHDVFYFYDKEPQAVNLSEIKSKITYPDILRETGLSGKVNLKLLIDQEGNVIKHLVARTAHPLFTESCLKEVYKLKFTPAIVKNKPRKAWISIPFDFKLK